MFESIRTQLSPAHQQRFERSVVATTGLLFGLVCCAVLAVLSGRPPLNLDGPMFILYASALPLSVFGAMKLLLKDPPKLPVLATLYFFVCFLPLLVWGESLLGRGTLHIAGLSIFLPKLIGFRLIFTAALAGMAFGGISADGARDSEEAPRPNADWEKRHREAVERLALVELDLRDRRAHNHAALEEFERRLADESERDVIEEKTEETVFAEAEQTAGVAA